MIINRWFENKEQECIGRKVSAGIKKMMGNEGKQVQRTSEKLIWKLSILYAK